MWRNRSQRQCQFALCKLQLSEACRCRSIGKELPNDVTLQDIIKTMPPEVHG